ncbi:uncharacterized protein STEHIDRAFT_154374 [Stereum hirsutum FP-91666 SS1]|uniref:uncharacterized protein n=1 Tax=Stereum hirsutum (strain FP-91666) TaxID=721885 RepID=UPI000440F2B1|nr:uncharacterized protein STEHIDRAFT_154374 [Stereum hirsutum FP-91666 SS1]EIM88646.1 hypothetical protein STEHIDRAFT_154374 [Stereum hirsutum FP-91666 SS1]
MTHHIIIIIIIRAPTARFSLTIAITNITSTSTTSSPPTSGCPHADPCPSSSMSNLSNLSRLSEMGVSAILNMPASRALHPAISPAVEKAEEREATLAPLNRVVRELKKGKRASSELDRDAPGENGEDEDEDRNGDGGEEEEEEEVHPKRRSRSHRSNWNMECLVKVHDKPITRRQSNHHKGKEKTRPKYQEPSDNEDEQEDEQDEDKNKNENEESEDEDEQEKGDKQEDEDDLERKSQSAQNVSAGGGTAKALYKPITRRQANRIKGKRGTQLNYCDTSAGDEDQDDDEGAEYVETDQEDANREFECGGVGGGGNVFAQKDATTGRAETHQEHCRDSAPSSEPNPEPIHTGFQLLDSGTLTFNGKALRCTQHTSTPNLQSRASSSSDSTMHSCVVVAYVGFILEYDGYFICTSCSFAPVLHGAEISHHLQTKHGNSKHGLISLFPKTSQEKKKVFDALSNHLCDIYPESARKTSNDVTNHLDVSHITELSPPSPTFYIHHPPIQPPSFRIWVSEHSKLYIIRYGISLAGKIFPLPKTYVRPVAPVLVAPMPVAPPSTPQTVDPSMVSLIKVLYTDKIRWEQWLSDVERLIPRETWAWMGSSPWIALTVPSMTKGEARLTRGFMHITSFAQTFLHNVNKVLDVCNPQHQVALCGPSHQASRRLDRVSRQH